MKKLVRGKSGLGSIKSEIDGMSLIMYAGKRWISKKHLKYDTEDSQFFIILEDEPLFEGEYTPKGIKLTPNRKL